MMLLHSRGAQTAACRLCAGFLLIAVSSMTPSLRATEEIDLATDADAVYLVGEDIGDETGVRMASCDINGDGILDLLAGAQSADGPANSRPAAGEAYVVYGRRGGWSGSLPFSDWVDVRVYGQDWWDSLGWGVACGDVNGDGYADLILGAYNADSIDNSRDAAGQIHIVFGGPSLSPEIDLLTDPGTMLWGAEPGHAVARELDAGDVNGDGYDDIVFEVDHGTGKNGLDNAGRVYIVFGRPAWPPALDMLTDADVIIYGEDASDLFGTDPVVADVNGDALDDIVANATLGDGPGNGRDAAGDVFVFFGRDVWPSEIDLAVTPADSVLYGPDPDDRAGNLRGLSVGDVDGDTLPELVVGVSRGDGPNNDKSKTGEARLVEMGPAPPPTIDIGLSYDGVLYGADPGDYFASGTRAGDMDGDGLDEVICDAPYADGPQDSRLSGGEIAVFLGQNPFPAEQDVSLGDEDFLIYGAQADDRLVVMATGDLNGDGLAEAVAVVSLQHESRRPEIVLLSPFDVDGDGISQLPDNCPLVYNPEQLDSDGDRRGDACTGDWDGDGQQDAADCAPADASGGTPPEISGVAFTPGSKTEFSWTAAMFSDTYDISRGDLASLDGSDYGSCQTDRDSDPTDTLFDDPDVPGVGHGFFYLVRGVDAACPAAGSWGADSVGAERGDSNPEACTL